jgi:DNA adenine methylase
MLPATASERKDLSTLENRIERALRLHLQAARALKEIRDRKLYREKWDTFEDYCHARWNISRAQGNRLCDWAEVAENLSPMGDKLPVRERHARPLARLTPPQQRTAWKQIALLPHCTEQTVSEVCQRVRATAVRGGGPLAERGDGEIVPSPIGWMGGKGSIASQIVALLPKHDTYIEPFLGGGAVLMAKPPSKIELVNDIHSQIISFFRILRDDKQAARLKRLLQLTPYAREEHKWCGDNLLCDDPVEQARRFFVSVRQSFGCAEGETWGRSLAGSHGPTRRYCCAVDRLDIYAERLRTVQIECKDFRSLLARCDKRGVCVYADPPYLKETRHRNGSSYTHDMTEKDHEDLLDILCGFTRASVVLSGHHSPMYEHHLRHWRRYEFSVTAKGMFQKSGRSRRTEVVWVSP